MISATSNRGFARFRSFSLRTGLVLFLLLGITFGLVGRWLQDVRERGATQRWLVEKDIETRRPYGISKPIICEYATEAKVSAWTNWIRKNVDAEFGRTYSRLNVSGDQLEENPQIDFSRIYGSKSVHLNGPGKARSVLMAFAVPHVQSISLSKVENTLFEPADWRGVAQAQQLMSIDVSGGPVSAEFAEQLARLPNLSNVRGLHSCTPEAFAAICRIDGLVDLSLGWLPEGIFANSQWPAESDDKVQQQLERGFRELAKQSKLTRMTVRGNLPLTPSIIRDFCNQSNLSELLLMNTGLSPECLKELVRLKKLTALTLDEPLITDEHLPMFLESSTLKSIQIRAGINNSGDAILALREKMPKCQIWRN